MTPEQFEAEIKRKAQLLKKACENGLLHKMGEQGKRFIQGNFNAQGWQGNSFEKWKPNKRKGRILFKTGKLRRDTSFRVEGTNVILENTIPYAKIHNEGEPFGKM